MRMPINGEPSPLRATIANSACRSFIFFSCSHQLESSQYFKLRSDLEKLAGLQRRSRINGRKWTRALLATRGWIPRRKRDCDASAGCRPDLDNSRARSASSRAVWRRAGATSAQRQAAAPARFPSAKRGLPNAQGYWGTVIPHK
jgi:hypothetical protein